MSMSDRNRRSHLAKAQTLVPESRVHAYAIGRSGTNPLVMGLVIGGCFIALAVAIALATGAFVLPGVLAFLVLQHLVSPPRGRGRVRPRRRRDQPVVAHREADPGDRPAARERPTRRAERVPAGVQVVAGQERIWLTAKEDAVLRSATIPTEAPVPYAG